MSYLSLLYSGVDEEKYSILKKLSLYDFYEELNKELVKELKTSPDLQTKCQYCQAKIASQAENGEKLINLCKQICNIIFNVHDILDKCNDKTGNKACNYMGYWLYYNVMSLTNNQSLVLNFYDPIFMYTTVNKSKFNNCFLKNFNLDKNKFYIKKILYEFNEIYDEIKNKISDEINLNIQSYCKHIKENFRFYNEVKDKCSNTSCEYDTELQAFKNKFNKTDVLEFIYEKCKYQKTSCKQGSNAEDDVPCLRKKGNPFLFLIFGDDPEHIINILLNFSLISAPILALFVILFKFTPLGKSLNKIKQERKKNGHKKKEENIQDYMKNYAAYLDSEMKNRVHLGYHAI
ncbi:VIR protein [Plasmodium vivax]|uniref:VIR protein n=1 Tax=Plasmodium vivax TaxID=5855 RepID=A0A1G4E2A5_PLAVI|nr:VIR protein [Plasmodium vivax]